MEGYFQAEETRSAMSSDNNPIVYQVYRKSVPMVAGELLHCLTVIHPGNVDGEFFMTKGHYHVNDDCAEIYYGVKGAGLLLLQKGAETKCIAMNPDVVAYIPAGWGHRTINISAAEPFVFFSIWPGDSGYDYQKSVDEPFIQKVFAENNSYQLR